MILYQIRKLNHQDDHEKQLMNELNQVFEEKIPSYLKLIIKDLKKCCQRLMVILKENEKYFFTRYIMIRNDVYLDDECIYIIFFSPWTCYNYILFTTQRLQNRDALFYEVFLFTNEKINLISSNLGSLIFRMF